MARTAHLDDRRRKLVTLTGRDAAATAEAIICEPPAALLALSAAELHQLDTLVGRLGRQRPERHL